MARRAINACELVGYRVRSGTTVLISQWLMHRDARFYDRPLEFDPDRWTPAFRQQLNQFAWFPFGAGPRKCIGDHFAMLEATLIVATIASRKKLVLLPGQVISPHASVTIRPSPQVGVTCRSRGGRVVAN